MRGFKTKIRNKQIQWRTEYLPNVQGKGRQNGRWYDHILPSKYSEYCFFPDTYDSLSAHIEEHRIQPHTGIHNLLSSWVVCANFYWPFYGSEGRTLLKQFFNTYLHLNIQTITGFELEYVDKNTSLQPPQLLREPGGARGTSQTTPDLGLIFDDENGDRGILLIESKFVEHSFYKCSGYSPEKCENTAELIDSDFTTCRLTEWGRTYWDLLKDDLNIKLFKRLTRCPMSTGCYQIFRQQALAKGFSAQYTQAISCVVADSRNDSLVGSAKRSGLGAFPDSWQKLFPNLPFLWMHHNTWFDFVNTHNESGQWDKWIKYIENRYINL